MNWAKAAVEQRQKRLEGYGNTTMRKVMEPIAYRVQLDGLIHLFGTVATGPKWGDNDAEQTVHLVEET
jgi:hypothetical protein